MFIPPKMGFIVDWNVRPPLLDLITMMAVGTGPSAKKKIMGYFCLIINK